jgi:LysM repeat protein
MKSLSQICKITLTSLAVLALSSIIYPSKKGNNSVNASMQVTKPAYKQVEKNNLFGEAHNQNHEIENKNSVKSNEEVLIKIKAKEGDTFWKYSQIYGVPLEQIIESNKHIVPEKWEVGQEITFSVKKQKDLYGLKAPEGENREKIFKDNRESFSKMDKDKYSEIRKEKGIEFIAYMINSKPGDYLREKEEIEKDMREVVPLMKMFDIQSKSIGLEDKLALVYVESRFNPHAIGIAGDSGLMQNVQSTYDGDYPHNPLDLIAHLQYNNEKMKKDFIYLGGSKQLTKMAFKIGREPIKKVIREMARERGIDSSNITYTIKEIGINNILTEMKYSSSERIQSGLKYLEDVREAKKILIKEFDMRRRTADYDLKLAPKEDYVLNTKTRRGYKPLEKIDGNYIFKKAS